MTASVRKLRSTAMLRSVTLLAISATFLQLVHAYTFNDAARYSTDNGKHHCVKKMGVLRLKLSSSFGNDVEGLQETKASIMHFIAAKDNTGLTTTRGALVASRFWLRILMYPIISAVVIFAAVQVSNAAVVPAIKSTNKIAMLEFHSILLKGIVSGACINLSKNIILHPLETVKARLDTGATADRTIFRNMYSGIVPAILGGVPAAAVFFGTKDLCRFILRGPELLGTLGPRSATILAVTFAQIPYWILRNPSEVIKTRLRTKLKSNIKLKVGIENDAKNKNSGSINPVSAEVDNIRNAEQKMKKDKRLISVFQDLYTGFSTNLLYALPSDWLKFLAYEFISQHIFGIDIGAGVAVSGYSACVCGSLAALFSETVCTPLDVARTRIMCVEKSDNSDIGGNKNTNVFSVLSGIILKEGPMSLFKGVGPRSARALLDGAVQFFAYEMAQNMLRKHF